MKKYGVYLEEYDEIFIMTETEVFEFLGKYDEGLFMNYGVYSDGDTVKIYELSAGGNGKISDLTVSEFFYEYDDGIMIREIGSNNSIKQFEQITWSKEYTSNEFREEEL